MLLLDEPGGTELELELGTLLELDELELGMLLLLLELEELELGMLLLLLDELDDELLELLELDELLLELDSQVQGTVLLAS